MKPRTFRDEFVLKKSSDMADSIAEMTYSYKNTVVPAKHYLGILNAAEEEVVNVERTCDVALNIVPVYEMMNKIFKEHPREYFMAVVMNETKTKAKDLTNVQYDALTEAWNGYSGLKPSKKKLLQDSIIDTYNEIIEHGLPFEEDMEEPDMELS